MPPNGLVEYFSNVLPSPVVDPGPPVYSNTIGVSLSLLTLKVSSVPAGAPFSVNSACCKPNTLLSLGTPLLDLPWTTSMYLFNPVPRNNPNLSVLLILESILLD